MSNANWRLVTLLGCAAALFHVVDANAQKPAPQRARIPVLVLVPEEDGSDQQEITVTRRPIDGGYVILLPKSAANPENLFAGALAVAGLMNRDGDALRDESVFRVAKTTVAPKREVAAGKEVLARLWASTPRDMNGVRRARFAYIYMPDQASRATAEASGKRRIFGQ